MSALPADTRARLDARVATRVVPLLISLAAAFGFFAVVTLAFRPPEATAIMLAIDATGALVLALASWRFHREPAPPGTANAIVFAALSLGLVASLAAIKLLHLPAETTNIMLLGLAASIILLGPAWVLSFLFVCLAGWTAVAWSEGLDSAWLNAGFSLVVTTIMSGMIQIVRLRDAEQAEALTTGLESAIAREKAHARDLTAANDSLEAFTYVVSHDLKEPLRGLRAYLEDLEETLPHGEARERYQRVVDTEERLTRLVHGLLEWSRASTTPTQSEPIDIAELLDEPTTRELFDRLLRERRGRLLIDRDIPRVQGAPALVRQVLGNLVVNSLRHNPRADPQIRVYAAPDAPRGMVDVVVEDNGPGYPRGVIERVAALKQRPSSVRGGFGLAIARRAAERMAGQLHLSNAEGGGAQAHVLLPAARARAEIHSPPPFSS